MTDQLPSGWTRVRLGDVCEPVSQRGPRAERPTFRYIDLGAIDNKAKRVAEANIIPTSGAPSRAKQEVRAGDVVFSTVRVYLENIAEVPEDLDGEIASTAFCVLRPAAGISSRYLYHYVTSRSFVLTVNELQRGNSPPSVQDGDIRSQAMPLAPPREQRRIASRIDELFSRIEEGEHALERVQRLVERYRQSVLKAAVTGELTRDWREKNKGQLESGEALLARILKARRSAWEHAELDKMSARGVTVDGDKWKAKYEEPLPPDIAGLPELPMGWAWASAEAVCESVHSGTTPEREFLGVAESTGIPFIKVYNLTMDGTLDFAVDPTFVDVAHHRQKMRRSRTVPGDVLTNIVGPPLGKVSVVPATHPEWNINQAVAAFRPLPGVMGDLLSIYLQSSLAKAWLRSTTKTTTSQVNLAITTCRRLPIPIPPASEQAYLCDAAKRALSNVDAAAAAVRALGSRSTALRQSVLRSAFSGELISQSASDEPASALLVRIASARNIASAKPARNTKNKSNESA